MNYRKDIIIQCSDGNFYTYRNSHASLLAELRSTRSVHGNFEAQTVPHSNARLLADACSSNHQRSQSLHGKINYNIKILYYLSDYFKYFLNFNYLKKNTLYKKLILRTDYPKYILKLLF